MEGVKVLADVKLESYSPMPLACNHLTIVIAVVILVGYRKVDSFIADCFLNHRNSTIDGCQRAVLKSMHMLYIISNHILQLCICILQKCTTLEWKYHHHRKEGLRVTHSPQSCSHIIIYLLSCQHHELPQQHCQPKFDVDGNRSQKRIVGLKRWKKMLERVNLETFHISFNFDLENNFRTPPLLDLLQD